MFTFKPKKQSTEQPKEKKVFKLDPTINIEKNIGGQIYNALQGQIVHEVLQKLPNSDSDRTWRITWKDIV